jgi:ribosomal protein L16/L10AE
MVSNEYEQLSSEALEAARICANKYVLYTFSISCLSLDHSISITEYIQFCEILSF